MFLHRRIRKPKKIENDPPTKNADYPYTEYSEEMLQQMKKERQRASEDLQSEHKPQNKQDYQPPVIRSGPYKSDGGPITAGDLPFDRNLAFHLLQFCDIQTIGRMMCLNSWWYQVTHSSQLNAVWAAEVSILRDYFVLGLTPANICDEDDAPVVARVVDLIHDQDANPLYVVSECYKTIRHFDLKLGKYRLMDPNPSGTFIDKKSSTLDELDTQDAPWQSMLDIYFPMKGGMPHTDEKSVEFAHFL